MALTRSQNMSRIRSTNTRAEIRLRQALWQKKLRYRSNFKIENNIRPDIVFTKHKLAIFVDGCQWHGCPKHYVRPRTNTEFWGEKLKINVERDILQTHQLKLSGWLVYRMWEHEIWENLEVITTKIMGIIRDRTIRTPTVWRVFQVDVIDPLTDKEKRYLCSLTSPQRIKTIEQYRSTKKWKRTIKKI